MTNRIRKKAGVINLYRAFCMKEWSDEKEKTIRTHRAHLGKSEQEKAKLGRSKVGYWH